MLRLDDSRIEAARTELSWLMSVALRLFRADAASVAISEGFNKHVRLGIVGHPGDRLEFISIDGTSTYCDEVITQDKIVNVSAASLPNSGIGDSFMRASGLKTYLGAPMADPSGLVLGAFAVMTCEERIWSRAEVSDLSSCARFGAHAIVGHARPDTPSLARAIAGV